MFGQNLSIAKMLPPQVLQEIQDTRHIEWGRVMQRVILRLGEDHPCLRHFVGVTFAP